MQASKISKRCKCNRLIKPKPFNGDKKLGVCLQFVETEKVSIRHPIDNNDDAMHFITLGGAFYDTRPQIWTIIDGKII